jgi:Rod binding domain-containing protein
MSGIPSIQAFQLGAQGPADAVRRLQASAAGAPAAGAQPDKAVQAAKDFESVLLLKVMDEMKKTVEDGGLTDSPGFKQTQDMFWYYLSQDVANKGGFGLWKNIYRQTTGHAAPEAAPKVEQSL